MMHPRRSARASIVSRSTGICLAAALLMSAALLLFDRVPPALAAQPPVALGTATTFAVLAGTTVTNTGSSVVSGDLGVSPGTAITGFPPGQVMSGTQHAADAAALQAQNDLTTGYNDAAGRTPATAASSDLGGQTLAPGVYKQSSALGLTGTVTLDGQSDPNAVFIFQVGSTLITASSSAVKLVGGAQACNIFWQVGSSATLGTNSSFVGSLLALTSASVQTGTTVTGRVLARNGQVSLDTNAITRPTCANATPASPGTSATATPRAATTATPTPSSPTVPGTGAVGTPPSAALFLVAIGSLIALVGSMAGGKRKLRRAAPGTRGR